MRQAWDELAKTGMEQTKIGLLILKLWLDNIAGRVICDFESERIRDAWVITET